MGTVIKNRGTSCVGVRKTGTTLIRVSTVMGTLQRALAEVINNEKKTTGFMVDGSYVKYYDALQNIDLIDNLAVTEDGVIRSTDKTLDKIDVSKVNK